MRWRTVLAGVAFLAFGAGCVPQKRYADVSRKLAEATEINRDYEKKLADAEVELAKWRTGVQNGEFLDEQVKMLREQNLLQRNRISQLEDSLTSAGFGGGGFDPKLLGAELGEFVDLQGHLILAADLLFNSGQATLKNGPKKALDRLAEVLQSEYAGRFIHLDGHTDSDPVAKTERVNRDNWLLGSRRAHAVFEYLVSNKGLDRKRFVLHSYGSSKPVEPNQSKAGKSKNRRVEIRLGGAKRV